MEINLALVHQAACTRLLLAPLWVMPHTDKHTGGKQAECPSIGEWLNSHTARNMRQFKNEEIKEIQLQDIRLTWMKMSQDAKHVSETVALGDNWKNLFGKQLAISRKLKMWSAILQVYFEEYSLEKLFHDGTRRHEEAHCGAVRMPISRRVSEPDGLFIQWCAANELITPDCVNWLLFKTE